MIKKFNIEDIKNFYETGKIRNENIIKEKENFINFANDLFKKIFQNKIEELSINDLKLLKKSVENSPDILIQEIIPYDNLPTEETKLLYNKPITDKNIVQAYETLIKYKIIKEIFKEIGVKIYVDLENIEQGITSFNERLRKLTIKEYIDTLFSNIDDLNILANYSNIPGINIIPYEIIFDSKEKLEDFLVNLKEKLKQNTLNKNVEQFLSDIIQKNTIKLFIDILYQEKSNSLEDKIKEFLEFYDNYISKSIYVAKVRNDFISLFGEIITHFKWIDNLKEKYIIGKYPDKLLRYVYIKYYPSFREILEDITTQNEYERLNLGFVSTIAFFERIYEKGLQRKYSYLMRDLYFKLIYPKLEKYKKNKPGKYDYFKNFLSKHPSFENDISENITKIDLINNLENISHISEYIKLHKEGKISKKLNKKDLKKLINDTIHFSEIKYLLDNNLVNVRKLSDFMDLCIPHLTTTGLVFLGMNKNFKQFLSKQKLLKLLKETKDIKFLVLLEKFNYTLSNKEQKQIIETLKNETNIIKLALLLGSKLITREYKEIIFKKLKNNYYFLQ